MDRYLEQHYKGKYRILPHYDVITNDIPRDYTGQYDDSYADFYIKCSNNIEIKHGAYGTSELSCYIPTKRKGVDVLISIYKDKISEVLPKEEKQTKKYSQNLCKELVKSGTLISAEVLDNEVYFEFKGNIIDYIATLVKARTNGSNISPLSKKNIPKTKYTIPDNDLKIYNQSILHFPKKHIASNGILREITDGLIIKRLNFEFDKIIKKNKGKNFNVKEDRTQKGLGNKEYIHYLGLWNEYCNFLERSK